MASSIWSLSPLIGLNILAVAAGVWATLLSRYVIHAKAKPREVVAELRHVATGPSGALPGITTMLIGLALLPHWRPGGIALALAGLAWQLPFSLWQAGGSLKNGRAVHETAPNIYLPTVAGNLTAGGVLGALGWTSWGWIFVGAGLFSWITLESIVAKALWTQDNLPLKRRALVGIHFAPPAVATMAWLL